MSLVCNPINPSALYSASSSSYMQCASSNSFAQAATQLGLTIPGTSRYKALIGPFREAARSDPESVIKAWSSLSTYQNRNLIIARGWPLITVTRELHLTSAATYIYQLLENPRLYMYDYFRGGLAELLGEIGDPEAFSHLMPLLADRYSTVRGPAARAIAHLGKKDISRLHSSWEESSIQCPDAYARFINILGWIGHIRSLPMLLNAYQDCSAGDDGQQASCLQAIGHIPHELSTKLILEELEKGQDFSTKAAAIQATTEMPMHSAIEAIPMLRNEIGDAQSMTYHRASAFFALLCLKSRLAAEELEHVITQDLNAFFDAAIAAPPKQPDEADYFRWHRAFCNKEELRAYIDIPDELAFVSVPHPSEWRFPKHEYEYYVEPTDSGVDITLYDYSPTVNRGHPWPARGEAADSYLREVGLTGDNKALLVIRGIRNKVNLPPLFSKLGITGHSHPRNSFEGESDNDMEAYAHYDMSLSVIRRNINSK